MLDINKILNIGYNNIAPSKGNLLLSTPFMDDAYFQRAAILIVEHEAQGTLGFVLDKPLDRTVGFLLEEISDFKSPLFIGGPVEQDRLNFLHTKGEMIGNSIEIISGVWLGGELNEVLQLIKFGLINEYDIRFFIGYSGWSDGQLESELKQDNWVVSALTAKELFETPHKNLWKLGLEQLGEQYAYWGKLPLHPEMN